MVDDLLLPAAIAAGGGLAAARHYLRHRLESPEDRYMALYGKEEWDASNMDLTLNVDPARHAEVEAEVRSRLAALLDAGGHGAASLSELALDRGDTLEFVRQEGVTVDVLCKPRRGIYFDFSTPGRITLVWNHMQLDGVGLWRVAKPLFDENPALLSFDDGRKPPPFLPELLAVPRVARRLTWRGSLHRSVIAQIKRGFHLWDSEAVRAAKADTGAPFNLVSSALVVAAVFDQHPHVHTLNVGLTVYFPFLVARNRYGVLTARVKRGDLPSIIRQMARQVRFPMVSWGVSAAQSYALNRIPDRLFLRVMGYYRRQVDVLISNLPVGTRPIQVAGVPVDLSCHPWELTLPYYFLIIGTRQQLHVSWTSRCDVPDSFATSPRVSP